MANELAVVIELRVTRHGITASCGQVDPVVRVERCAAQDLANRPSPRNWFGLSTLPWCQVEGAAMWVIVLAAAGVLFGGFALAAVAPCSDLLQIGQAASERVNLLQTTYDTQQERLRAMPDRLVARNEADRLASELERAYAKLRLAVTAARDAGCEPIDALVEAQSEAAEAVQAARAGVAEMAQPQETGSVNDRR
jgi:hypothetical protein